MKANLKSAELDSSSEPVLAIGLVARRQLSPPKTQQDEQVIVPQSEISAFPRAQHDTTQCRFPKMQAIGPVHPHLSVAHNEIAQSLGSTDSSEGSPARLAHSQIDDGILRVRPGRWPSYAKVFGSLRALSLRCQWGAQSRLSSPLDERHLWSRNATNRVRALSSSARTDGFPGPSAI